MAEKTGRLAVVLPQGALFRGGEEGKIRRKLLEMDIIEGVIGLAPNLFYGTSLAACIMVLRKRKAPERRRKVIVGKTYWRGARPAYPSMSHYRDDRFLL